jgi:hypothetical protein
MGELALMVINDAFKFCKNGLKYTKLPNRLMVKDQTLLRVTNSF